MTNIYILFVENSPCMTDETESKRFNIFGVYDSFHKAEREARACATRLLRRGYVPTKVKPIEPDEPIRLYLNGDEGNPLYVDMTIAFVFA